MFASLGGHPEMVKLLLERGATVDQTDNVRNRIDTIYNVVECDHMRLLELG